MLKHAQVEYHVGMGSDPGTVALKKYSADNNIVLQVLFGTVWSDWCY
jgi:hypothetical protein